MVATLISPTDTMDETLAVATRAEQLRQMEARLEKGWTLLEGGRGSAEELARWETSWLRLLRQYEALHDAAA
jgi:hypothetical protein